jgi:dTDP-4-amino-4,6-dideoxygalactose transaminase
LGGEPAAPAGPPDWPLADESVRSALEAAFADGSWGRYYGPHCERLRAELTALHNVEHVVLCCSGTIGVELALRGLGVGAGDEVALAGYDFGGNFRAIEAVGARPLLVDIDPGTWCLDVESLDSAIGPETRAVIASHLHGGMAPMRRICELGQRRGLAVVEDACQAHGAVVDGRPAGAWGDAGVLSFGGSKLLTAGRGGAVLTDSPHVAQRIKVFAQRGNDVYALSELQAAVLPPQIDALEVRNRQRSGAAARLMRATASIAWLQPLADCGPGSPVFYKLPWLLSESRANEREIIAAALEAEGVAIGEGFRGFVNRSDRRCRRAESLACSAAAAARTLVLHHPVLLAEDERLDQVAAAWGKVAAAMDSGQLTAR